MPAAAIPTRAMTSPARPLADDTPPERRPSGHLAPLRPSMNMPTDLSRPPAYPSSHDLLAGRRVLITAAAGTGIGYAAAKRCAEEGAAVLISDIHERRLREAADRLHGATGIRPATQLCDVTVQADVDALFAAGQTVLGPVDVVINNAGLGGAANLVDMTDEQWSIVLDVSLNGTFRMTRAAMQAMRGRGGVIVNNASVLGWRAQKGQAHYAAAKAGVMALTPLRRPGGRRVRRARQRGRSQLGHASIPGPDVIGGTAA